MLVGTCVTSLLYPTASQALPWVQDVGPSLSVLSLYPATVP